MHQKFNLRLELKTTPLLHTSFYTTLMHSIYHSMQTVWKRSWSEEGPPWELFCITLDPSLGWPGNHNTCRRPWVLLLFLPSFLKIHQAVLETTSKIVAYLYIYFEWMGGLNGVYSTAKKKMKIENVQMRVCLCMQLLRKGYCDHVLSVVRLNHFRKQQGARVTQWVRSLDLTTHTRLSPIWRGDVFPSNAMLVNNAKQCIWWYEYTQDNHGSI
jgi:hypothetical protein